MQGGTRGQTSTPLAEQLIPKNHGFGTRRVPLETGYDGVDNQANVELVDLQATPIERITPTGVRLRRAPFVLRRPSCYCAS